LFIVDVLRCFTRTGVDLPIYEYYCPDCHGRFSHLARNYDAPSPPCPRCGSVGGERLVSAANVVHSSSDHQAQLKTEAAAVDGQDLQAAAQFLENSGRLADAEGLYGSRAYKELIARRAAGATDRDLEDLVDDLVAQTAQMDNAGTAVDEAGAAAAAVALSKQVNNRVGAEGPADGHEHGAIVDAPDAERQASDRGASGTSGDSGGARSRRAAKDLGWG
jgi:putative FmdB family regulatory protein